MKLTCSDVVEDCDGRSGVRRHSALGTLPTHSRQPRAQTGKPTRPLQNRHGTTDAMHTFQCCLKLRYINTVPVEVYKQHSAQSLKNATHKRKLHTSFFWYLTYEDVQMLQRPGAAGPTDRCSRIDGCVEAESSSARSSVMGVSMPRSRLGRARREVLAHVEARGRHGA